jgi:hypothetical protein
MIMSFCIGVILFLLGSGLVGLLLWAIPGPEGAAPAHGSGHGHHGGH